MKILLRIAYKGTNYCGWQAQNNGKSIQEVMTDAATKVFGIACDLTGCSRTDSGVHANDFCATVTEHGKSYLNTTIPENKIPVAYNCFLPDDISVLKAIWVDDGFHPRYDVLKKEYKYIIYTACERDPFLSDRAWHIPKKLDAVKMNEAARRFIGKNDFSSFMASGSKIVDTVRTVYSAEVTQDNGKIVFTVSADGFLYNMVRIMVGTLVDVGEGKKSPDCINSIIGNKDRSKSGVTAPPYGLYLNRVEYKSK